MEFANLGAHCAVQLCRQRDFLPFKCDACGSCYCLEHRSYASHACRQADGRDHRVISCPLCLRSIHFAEGLDINATFERHCTSECTPESRAQRAKKERCGAPGCKEKLGLSNRATCGGCRLEVCLAHRHADDHQCAAAAAAAAAAASKARGGQAGSSSSGFFSKLTGGSHAPGKAAPAPASSGRSAAANAAAAAAAARAAAPKPGSRKAAPAAAAASSSSRPRPAAAAAAVAAVDPGNTVKGTAARRMNGGGQGSSLASSSVSTSASAGGGGSGDVEVCPSCSASFPTVAELIAHAEEAHQGSSTRCVPAAAASSSGGCVIH